MATTLKEKMAALDPGRRAKVEAEADRLQAECLTLKDLRRARELTQVQLAQTLGVQQATVAKYERQGDLHLSTLASYVRAMGGELRLVVEFPGRAPVELQGIVDPEETRRRRATRRKAAEV